MAQANDGGGALAVVITGGSRGLAIALALENLAAGDSVVICGRDDARLRAACAIFPAPPCK
jgi:NAD(P)-dependent dehydrogenase (short-subunit alcohol dehydrogenase family)